MGKGLIYHFEDLTLSMKGGIWPDVHLIQASSGSRALD
jgi:hypothetical protein